MPTNLESITEHEPKTKNFGSVQNLIPPLASIHQNEFMKGSSIAINPFV